ncbi:hypothetical protein [Sphingomonas sp.]|jgi:aspartate/methionine/tyrosine aminotransferase|uniref:hypothetical protein n=1 Tax=Sphingomonas sp. TaxID=28214 RepID=UPI002E3465C4|nr:hypothetical protein [Sphingomonas sp.]HEX4693568.1 hypothetical protein [Sphingomonas sp.]
MRRDDRSALPPAPPIASLEWLALLSDIRQRFADRFGYKPDNLSYWNPKPLLGAEVERRITPPRVPGSLTEYTYTSDLDLHADIPRILGEPPGRSCLFTPSGTTSIANVVAYLRNAGVGTIAAVQPHYFAFSEFARFCGVGIASFDVERGADGYHLPSAPQVIASGAGAAWISNPVYGTSVYYDEDELREWLAAVTDSGIIVVVDESLAYADRAVTAVATDASLLIGIYVPHKALSLNGFRFSAVTFPEQLHASLEQWSDLFSGGLSAGNLDAIRHFSNPTFGRDMAIARAIQGELGGRMEMVVSEFSFVEHDRAADGHFRQLYFPALDASWQYNRDFLERLIFATGASFIPSARFSHPASSNFCFRINLFRLDDAGVGALHRLMRETGAIILEQGK